MVIENNEGTNGMTPEENRMLGGQEAGEPVAHPVEFGALEQGAAVKPEVNFNLLMDVTLKISVVIGGTTVMVKDLLKMGQGSVIELDKTTNEPVDILVNGKPFAKGEIVVVEDNFGVRITEISTPAERMNTLQ